MKMDRRRNFSLAAFALCGLLIFSCACLPAQTQENPQTECRVQLTQGEDALHREQFPAAVQAAEAARSVCVDKTESLLLLARAHMLLRQFDEAIQSLDLVLSTDSKNASALLLKGQVLYLSDHDNEAGHAFHDAVNAAPDKAEPHYWLGKFLYETKQAAQAIDEFHAALRADASFYRAYDGLGLAYAAVGENDHAVESYLAAIKLTASTPHDYDEAYADLAELLLHLGRNAQAFDAAAEAADRNPVNPRDFFLAGKAAEQSEKYDASLRWLKRAAELDPAYPDPHYLLARVYRRLGQNDKAAAEAAVYQKLAAVAPKVRR